MAVSLLVLVVAGHAAVATGYLEARRRREAPPRWARLAGPVTVALHLLGLVLLGHDLGRSPFSNPSQAMSFLAFALAALYLLLEATSRVATHGGGFYALVAVLAALSVPGLVGTPADGAALEPRNATRSMHVGLALLASAAVFASGLLAAGYLAAYRRMKRGTLRTGAPGLSLRGFERLARRSALLAAVLLLPAVVLGTRLGGQGGPLPGHAVITLTAITGLLLVVLAVAFLIWWRRPLRGALAAWLTLGGTALLLVAMGVAHRFVLAVG